MSHGKRIDTGKFSLDLLGLRQRHRSACHRSTRRFRRVHKRPRRHRPKPGLRPPPAWAAIARRAGGKGTARPDLLGGWWRVGRRCWGGGRWAVAWRGELRDVLVARARLELLEQGLVDNGAPRQRLEPLLPRWAQLARPYIADEFVRFQIQASCIEHALHSDEVKEFSFTARQVDFEVIEALGQHHRAENFGVRYVHGRGRQRFADGHDRISSHPNDSDYYQVVLLDLVESAPTIRAFHGFCPVGLVHRPHAVDGDTEDLA